MKSAPLRRDATVTRRAAQRIRWEESPMRTPNPRRNGFAAAELMIVVAILGLLAAVALPQFGSSTRRKQCDAVQRTLAQLRAAIDKYWAQHDGFPGPTAEDLERQLTGTTDRHGATGSLGPYVPGGEFPVNPVTGRNDVRVVRAMSEAPDGHSGWMYCPTTGELRSDATGCSADGVPWFDL
jgi:general secretion pathway protein G